MAAHLSREFLLAAACSIWPPSAHRAEVIGEAAAGSLDWERFQRVVMRHGVIGLANDALKCVSHIVPSHIKSEIAAQAVALIPRSLVLAAEAVRLQGLFDQCDLPIVFIKGPSLATLAFGNLGLRYSKDLDVLVPPRLVAPTIALLQRSGYLRFDPPADTPEMQMQLLLPLRKDLGFVRETNQLELELHWRLFINPHFMDETSIFAASRVVPLGGKGGVRTLGDEDLFSYLCAHGALHSWAQLKWLADVGALLAIPSKGGVEHLYRAAKVRGVERAAAQALMLCRRFFGISIPAQLNTEYRGKATLRWLDATALSAMSSGNGEVAPANRRFGTTRGSLSSFLLSRNWRYKLSELKLQLTCQTDVLTIGLPAKLKFLYPVLRLPLWLWRHSTGTTH